MDPTTMAGLGGGMGGDMGMGGAPMGGPPEMGEPGGQAAVSYLLLALQELLGQQPQGGMGMGGMGMGTGPGAIPGGGAPQLPSY